MAEFCFRALRDISFYFIPFTFGISNFLAIRTYRDDTTQYLYLFYVIGKVFVGISQRFVHINEF